MDFLHGKASNFRLMLQAQASTPEALALLEQYNDADLETLIRTHLLPLYLLGQLDIAVQKVVEVFPLVDALKVRRYFSCFCECLVAPRMPAV